MFYQFIASNIKKDENVHKSRRGEKEREVKREIGREREREKA